MNTEVVKQLLSQPANVTIGPSDLAGDPTTPRVVLWRDENADPLVWVIPNVLSSDECQEVINKAERAGMTSASEGTGSIRTAKRTTKYEDEDLSDLVYRRLMAKDFGKLLEKSDGLSFNKVHSNWRLVRYDAGDYFCPHYDQADILTPLKKDGTKDFFFSS